VHLVGFTIEMYYDAGSCERQIRRNRFWLNVMQFDGTSYSTSDLGGAQFEPQPGHRLFWLDLLSSFPQGIRRRTVLNYVSKTFFQIESSSFFSLVRTVQHCLELPSATLRVLRSHITLQGAVAWAGFVTTNSCLW